MFPGIKTIFPFMYNTMSQVTQAMIYLSQNGYERNVIYVKDIRKLSKISKSNN